jgi:hypothetical protein
MKKVSSKMGSRNCSSFFFRGNNSIVLCSGQLTNRHLVDAIRPPISGRLPRVLDGVKWGDYRGTARPRSLGARVGVDESHRCEAPKIPSGSLSRSSSFCHTHARRAASQTDIIPVRGHRPRKGRRLHARTAAFAKHHLGWQVAHRPLAEAASSRHRLFR